MGREVEARGDGEGDRLSRRGRASSLSSFLSRVHEGCVAQLVKHKVAFNGIRLGRWLYSYQDLFALHSRADRLIRHWRTLPDVPGLYVERNVFQPAADQSSRASSHSR